MKKNISIVFILVCLLIGKLNAQITVAGSNGDNGVYTSLTNAGGAFAALNAGASQAGFNVTITITANVTTEAGTNSLTGAAGMWSSLTITPSGARTISGAVAGVLINLNGADNVTIDGLNAGGNSLIIENTSTNVAASTIRFIADASNNTISNCTIKGSGTANTLGVVWFSTATGVGNDNNVINLCDIGPSSTNLPYCLIYSLGTATRESSGNSITNCNIHDWLQTGANCIAVNISTNNTAWTVTGNSIYQSASRACGLYGIRVVNSGVGFTVSDNYIGGSAALATGTLTAGAAATAYSFYGIYMSVGTTSTSTISGNTIKNINFTALAGGQELFSAILGIAGNIITTGNTVGDNATGSISLSIANNGTNDAFTDVIYYSGANGSITNNTIGSITIAGTMTNTTGGGGTFNIRTFSGIYVGSALTAAFNITGNTIGSATTANSIQTSAATVTTSMWGIGTGTTGAFAVNIIDNVIANITSLGGSTLTNDNMYGIVTFDAGTVTIMRNSVRDLATATRNSTTGRRGVSYLAFIGIGNQGTGACTITENNVYNMKLTSAASTPLTQGIWIGNTIAGNVISKNIVYNLESAADGTNMFGIQISNGSTVAAISNNMVRLGYNVNGTSNTFATYYTGISTSNTATSAISFNSVYIGGIGVNNVAANYTTCFDQEGASVDVVRSNIFQNTRANSGAGAKHYAITNDDAAGITSDYNNLYTSVAADCGSYDGGTTARTFAAWKTGTTEDANSLNVDAVFVSPTSATPDLHIQSTSTMIGNAIVVAGITDDIDLQTRSTGVKPNGPTIGADEYCGSPVASYAVYAPDGSATVTDCQLLNSTVTCAKICKVCTPSDDLYSNVNISTYPVIFSGDATNNYVNCTGVNTNMTATAPATPSWTSFGATSVPVSSVAAGTVTVQYTTTGRKNIVTSGPYTYTGFNNMLMAAPSPGTISALTNICPGTYSYSSSVAGTPGYTYSWSYATSGGSASIASSTSSSTNVTFTNNTGANQTFTLTLNVRSECCGPLTAVTTTVLVYPSPAAPSAAAPGSPCPGSSLTLSATVTAGYSYNWYDASTGGTLLGSGNTYTVNPVASGTTNYYLEATSTTGCVSPRTTVAVTASTPSVPVPIAGSSCGPDFITLSVNSLGAGYTYNWYTGSCGGTLVQSSTATAYTAFTAATTTYYVSAFAPGCNESTCATVVATVNAAPATITWLGVSGGLNNWFTPSNWTSGCLPTCQSDVVIVPNGGSVVAQPDIGFNPSGNAACKSINLQASSVLSFSDTKAVLDVCGDFTHSGTLTTNDLGAVWFLSTTQAQTYTRSGTGSFNDVVLFNTFTTPTLTINNDMTLGAVGNFTFQNGKVITGANNLIITNPATSSVAGHAATRFVQGNLRRYLNATGSYDFPVGHATKGYQLANVNFTTATTITYLTANFQTYGVLPAPLGSTECLATYNLNALDNGFWDIEANNTQNNSGTYNMTLYNTNYTNAGAGWTIMSRHNGSATWGLLNGDGSAGTCVASPVTAVQRNGMKGFSLFGNAQSSTTLPIELLSFTAIYNGANVDLKWVTSNEINNSYFTIERSIDGIEFVIINKTSTKAPNGNSNTQLSYASIDSDVSEGIYYYRLKQTDINDVSKYSSIETVTIGGESDIFNIQPNPATSIAQINYRCFDSESATLKMYDNSGKLLLMRNINCSVGQNSAIIDLSAYAEGMYFVTLSTKSKVFKTKLIKSSE